MITVSNHKSFEVKLNRSISMYGNKDIHPKRGNWDMLKE